MAESLQSRIETYRQSWNSGSLDQLLSHWVEDGLDYSDYREPTNLNSPIYSTN